jgi:hypothetical protein
MPPADVSSSYPEDLGAGEGQGRATPAASEQGSIGNSRTGVPAAEGNAVNTLKERDIRQHNLLERAIFIESSLKAVRRQAFLSLCFFFLSLIYLHMIVWCSATPLIWRR